MATKVQVKNFQSIKNATVDVEGFTVITGKNNSGKTALQRAIRGTFENARGHSFVRHGEDNCEVSVSFDDGDKVTWFKGKKENKYVINGKTYDKVGAGVPEELSKIGVFPIQCGGKSISPQFAPQFTGQVFLLNETGSVLAEAVSDMERVSKLNKALKQSEKDKRAFASELKVRKADKKKYEADLKNYDGLEEIQFEIDTMDSRQEELDALEKEINSLKGLLNKYKKSEAIVEHLTGVSSLSIPNGDTLERLQEEVSELKQKHTKLDRSKQGVSLLEGMFSHVEGELGCLENESLISAIKRCSSGVELLTGLLGNMSSSNIKVEDIKKEISKNEQALEDLEQELHNTLKEHSSCPLCGGEV